MIPKEEWEKLKVKEQVRIMRRQIKLLQEYFTLQEYLDDTE